MKEIQRRDTRNKIKFTYIFILQYYNFRYIIQIDKRSNFRFMHGNLKKMKEESVRNG